MQMSPGLKARSYWCVCLFRM